MTQIPEGQMEVRRVGLVQGWRWIAAGFRLFAKNPLIWITFFLIYFAVELVLVFAVPVVGPVISALLDPFFIAGFMAGCRALETGEELEIVHLTAGRDRAPQLAKLGAMYFGGKLVIIIAAMVLANIVLGPMPEFDFSTFNPASGDLPPAVVQHIQLTALLVSAFLVPLLMAYWFAPALVLFDHLPPKAAMKQSFAACRRNLGPFLLYGAASLFLFVLATIPLGLGLLAVVPVLFATSVYAGYRDIFVAKTPADGPSAVP